MTNKLSALVPFAGFYETWHDAEFDDVLSRMFDIEGDGASYAAELASRFFDTIDWQAAQTEYAQEYCSRFAAALGMKVCEFEEMNSPREYNFTTDRLFCLFLESELQSLFNNDDVRAELDKVAADMFTSRSGFISFYSPDVTSWPETLGEWDHNQRGALLKAAANIIIKGGEEFGQSDEFDLMESPRCNGEIDNWIWGNTTDGAVMGNRCDKVARYLALRESR